MQISLHWNPVNPGKALVIPVSHHENVYTLPDELAGNIAAVVRRVALAMRTGYPADGVTAARLRELLGHQAGVKSA